MNQKIEDLQLQENKLETRKRDVYDQNQALKHQMASQFEDLRQRLDAKERELLQKIDEQAIR